MVTETVLVSEAVPVGLSSAKRHSKEPSPVAELKVAPTTTPETPARPETEGVRAWVGRVEGVEARVLALVDRARAAEDDRGVNLDQDRLRGVVPCAAPTPESVACAVTEVLAGPSANVQSKLPEVFVFIAFVLVPVRSSLRPRRSCRRLRR